MNILIWSTAPWVKTGYGKNCQHLVRALINNHNVSVAATYGLNGGTINVGGVNIYPSNGDFSTMDEFVSHWAKVSQADLIIQHFDIWVLRSFFARKTDFQCPIVTYTPIDSENMPQQIKESVDGCYDNIAMTRYAQDKFHYSGLKSSSYIPHTVDMETYYPEDKKSCRKELGLPEDAFIIGCVGTNKGARKNLVGQLTAFKDFLQRNREARKTSFFFLHSYIYHDANNPQGFDIARYVKELDIEENVFSTDPFQYMNGLEERQMRLLYNTFDCLTECSYGEGFGIPIIESQSCGTPVIGPDFAATGEVIGKGGVVVNVSDQITWLRLPTIQRVPSHEGIIKAYEEMFHHSQEYTSLSIENARQYSLTRWNREWNDYISQI